MSRTAGKHTGRAGQGRAGQGRGRVHLSVPMRQYTAPNTSPNRQVK